MISYDMIIILYFIHYNIQYYIMYFIVLDSIWYVVVKCLHVCCSVFCIYLSIRKRIIFGHFEIMQLFAMFHHWLVSSSLAISIMRLLKTQAPSTGPPETDPGCMVSGAIQLAMFFSGIFAVDKDGFIRILYSL